MSYLESFPRERRFSQRTFWSISRLWFTNKFHADECKCPECFLGPIQKELRL